MASKKKAGKARVKSAKKPARKSGGKASKGLKHRSCPECGKVGFNSRSHPKHLPREKRGY